MSLFDSGNMSPVASVDTALDECQGEALQRVYLISVPTSFLVYLNLLSVIYKRH